jgi:hypothetical protein
MSPCSSLSEVGSLKPVAPQPAIITPSLTSWRGRVGADHGRHATFSLAFGGSRESGEMEGRQAGWIPVLKVVFVSNSTIAMSLTKELAGRRVRSDAAPGAVVLVRDDPGHPVLLGTRSVGVVVQDVLLAMGRPA